MNVSLRKNNGMADRAIHACFGNLFKIATRGKGMFNGPVDTKGNDEIVSAGIESLWLMPRGIYGEAYGQRVKRANS